MASLSSVLTITLIRIVESSLDTIIEVLPDDFAVITPSAPTTATDSSFDLNLRLCEASAGVTLASRLNCSSGFITIYLLFTLIDSVLTLTFRSK